MGTRINVWYLLTAYVHIMAAVFWVGYALFWTIMVGSLRQRFDNSESSRLLQLINQAPWPPASVPFPFYVKFSGLGWAALGILSITGIFLLHFRSDALQQILSGEFLLSSFGQTFAVKLTLVIALLLCQLLLAYRPAPRVISLNMWLTLLISVLSVLLLH
jgi:uncharacterized membrane protein